VKSTYKRGSIHSPKPVGESCIDWNIDGGRYEIADCYSEYEPVGSVRRRVVDEHDKHDYIAGHTKNDHQVQIYIVYIEIFRFDW
jgi:hypothetical protein